MGMRGMPATPGGRVAAGSPLSALKQDPGQPPAPIDDRADGQTDLIAVDAAGIARPFAGVEEAEAKHKADPADAAVHANTDEYQTEQTPEGIELRPGANEVDDRQQAEQAHEDPEPDKTPLSDAFFRNGPAERLGDPAALEHLPDAGGIQ